MEPALWIALITALGVGTLLPKIWDAIAKAVSGRVGRERDAVQYERGRADRERARADEASERADDEASKRRRLEEALSEYRRRLIDLKVDPGQWPIESTTPRHMLPNQKE